MLIGHSCGPKQQGSNFANLSKTRYAHFDKKGIDKIELQIIDSSISDPRYKELPPLAQVGHGFSFIDSSGKQTCKPTQILIYKDSTKDKLLTILNSYLDIPQDTTIETACFRIYRHVFTLYNINNQVVDRAYICLDCTRLEFRRLAADIKFMQDDKKLFSDLIGILRKTNAYVPTYGPASEIAN